MNTIHIPASQPYSVVIGNNILSQLGSYVSQLSNADKIAIISDTHVWPIYQKTVTDSLRAEQLEIVHYIFTAGEESKNLQTYAEILNFLAENQLTRSDLIIALGGGVVGDISGFAAATYLRGIGYIQIPTSLLAMVDSSVGGKTAVDLPAGKNLAGAFYQPRLVLCDIQVLETLPEEIFRDGCAEVIKYGVLYDKELFDHLLNNGLAFEREAVISRCVELKRDVVAEDEFDTGARQKLNLGHTVGHAIEALSQFTVSHGQSVAIGMAIVARAARKRGCCTEETAEQILSALRAFKLPIQTVYAAEDIGCVALTDKKRLGNTVNLIVPQQIGQCVISKIPIEQLQSFIEAGL